MDFFLGFDPGGEHKFGWCVCSVPGDSHMQLVAAGNASHANGAFEACLSAIPDGELPAAAGIDAPLFWVTEGGRRSDSIVRDAIGRLGAPSRSGTVQHFNSLQGSCVIQGMMLAKLLRSRFPGLPITEAHPKALLWLLGFASSDRLPAAVTTDALCAIGELRLAEASSEHVRDAVLAAITARAMVTQENGWVDLISLDEGAIRAVEGRLGYWMPIGE